MIPVPGAREVPVRTCLGCGAKKRQRELLRFVASRDRLVVFDEKGVLSGRGVYCCPSEKCLTGFVKKQGRIAKALRLETIECRGLLDMVRKARVGKLSSSD